MTITLNTYIGLDIDKLRQANPRLRFLRRKSSMIVWEPLSKDKDVKAFFKRLRKQATTKV